MISALIYLQFHSVRNRLLMRIKRLKQPKYLFGAIVGAIYFYWYFFRHFLGFGMRRPGIPAGFSVEYGAVLESVGAVILFMFVLLAWILPHERVALAFTEAEVAFLFPAPISRRGLIHFKLVRSQIAILFTTFFLTLVSNRFGGSAFIHAAGWWLILSTLNLHFLGSSFAMTMLMERGISTWQRRTGVITLAALLAAGVVFWARQTMPAFDLSRIDSVESVRDLLQQIMDSGPAYWLLLPFRLMVRPYLAAGWRPFLLAAWPAVLLLALHYVWVVRSNVAFEEASVEASKKLAERVAEVRAGNWRGTRRKLKARPGPFVLHPTGLPALAFLWKNLISSGRGFAMRTWIILAVIALAVCIFLAQSEAGSAALIATGSMAGMGLAWALLLGPQVVRRDFRQDLLMADQLKTYPLPGWQVALGEVLAPAAILARIEWFLMIPAGTALFLAAGFLTVPIKIALLAGAALLVPLLNLITLQIPNAAVLLFPGWFQIGKEGPQGIEATGQRLIFMLGQLLVFIVSLLPAAVAFSVVFFLLKLILPMAVAIVAGAGAAALALAIEAAAGVFLLGWLFERFDIATELTP